jgi:hypothetical protein
MFDTARIVAKEHKPDLILFAFNGAALNFPRLWRTVKEVKPDFYRMYQTRNPDEQIDANRAMVHNTPITKRLTEAWCSEMDEARKRGDADRLRNDPLVRDLVAEYEDATRERTVPRAIVNFYSPRMSFVYKYIKYRDPFRGIQKFSQESIWAPLSLDVYAADPDFIEAVKALKASKIPVYILYIPTLEEIKRFQKAEDRRFVPVDAGHASALKKIEDATGAKVIYVPEHYPRALLADPLALVASEADSHPSRKKGVAVLAEIFEDLVVDPSRFERH